MDQRAQRAQLLLVAVDVAMALLLILAFGTLAARDPFYFIEKHPEVLVLPGFFVAFFYLGSLYDVRRRWRPISILLRGAAMTCLGTLFFHVFHAATSTNVGVNGLSVSLSFGMALGVAFVRGAYLPQVRKKPPAENALVFGGGCGGCEILKCLKRKPWGRVRPVGIIDDNLGKRNFVYRDIPVLGTRQSLCEVVRRYDVGLVINAAPQVDNDELQKSLAKGSTSPVEVVDLPEFYERTTGRLMLKETENGWAVRGDGIEAGPSRAGRRFKRYCDVFYALSTLLLAVPLILAVAILLGVLSKKSVLAEEEKAGKRGRPFYLLSFRTNGLPRWAGAARLLQGIEKTLSLTQLHALPMLINVLKGDMSFFGPVPESPGFVKQAKEKNALYALRLLVKPGLVGWAEVNLSGRNHTAGHLERLGYDLYYVKNMSNRLDLKVLAGLCKTVLLSPERL